MKQRVSAELGRGRNSQAANRTKRSRRRIERDEDAAPEERAEGTNSDAHQHIPKSDDDDKEKRLACPFYKLNRLKYQYCLHFSLARVKDVKQHILRKHAQPHYCPSCGMEFTSQEEQMGHSRVQRCRIENYPTPAGVSLDQRKKLSARLPTGISTSDAWFSIWDVLFPERSHPSSVYVETPMKELLSAFQEFCMNEGQSLVRDQTEEHHSKSTSSDELRRKSALQPLATQVTSTINRLIQAYSTAIDEAFETSDTELDQPRQDRGRETCSPIPHEERVETVVLATEANETFPTATMLDFDKADDTVHSADAPNPVCVEPWELDFGLWSEESAEWSDHLVVGSDLESLIIPSLD